jgi:glutathione reductase (NADPH)
VGEGTTVVIGAGTAGNGVARRLGRAGRRVVLAEHDRAGGTCLWHGCVPKKVLYRAARARHQAARASRMGVGRGEAPSLDWARVRSWQREVMEAYAGDQEGILREAGVELVRGTARFTAPDTVTIDGRCCVAEQIVIASGSRPVLPGLTGAELMDTSDDALFYDELPSSLIVVGGGYIAMEMAAIYAMLGTAVRVLVRGDRVLDGFDPEGARLALEHVRALGADVRLGVEVLEVRDREGTRTVVARRTDNGQQLFTAERVLAATGRRPAVAELDPEAGGVELDERGAPRLDEHLHSVSNPRVWAAGDAAGGPQHTPVAGYEGQQVAASLLEGVPQAVEPGHIPAACFTAPELAQVGLLESELAARGRPYSVARGGFGSTAQGIIRGEGGGAVKLLFDEEERLVGAHLAGPDASELIHGLAVALRAGARAEHVATRAIHPSLAEGVVWTVSSAQRVTPGQDGESGPAEEAQSG